MNEVQKGNLKKVLKGGANILVSIGVGAIVGNLVRSSTPIDVGTLKKGCIGLGTLVLSGMASEKAVAYTEEKIDETIKTIEGDPNATDDDTIINHVVVM